MVPAARTKDKKSMAVRRRLTPEVFEPALGAPDPPIVTESASKEDGRLSLAWS
jgi:hypothetical protein